MGKKRFFQSDLKNNCFPRKSDTYVIRYGDMGKKLFFKLILKTRPFTRNVIFGNMGNRIFQNGLKNVVYHEKSFFQSDLKKLPYPRNDIFEDWQKTIFKSDLKKGFVLKMLIFRNIWAKKDFFKVISNNVIFPRNVDLFGLMDKKLFIPKRSEEKYLFLTYSYLRRYGLKTIFSK